MKRSARQRYVLLAVVAYAVLALIWIFLSDQLLAAIVDIESVVWLSTAKGVFFVLVSATAFYFALSAVPAESGSSRAPTQALLEDIAARPWPRWLAYGFAVTLVVVVAVVLSQLPPVFADRPPLILFMLPIILAAMLGGFGPGLVATLAAGAASAYNISPAGRLFIGANHDLFQWSLLLVNGLTASLISESMHQLWRRERARRQQLDAAYAALSQSEARFRHLFQDAPVAMGLAGKDGTILALNARVEQLFGYKLEDIPNIETWAARAYPDPDYRAQALAAWNGALADADKSRGSIEAGEYRVLCKDGSDRVVRITAMVMSNGLLTAFIDLTAIRNAEQAVTEAQAAVRRSLEERQRALELLGTIADATDDAIFAKDREGRILLINRAASQVVGQSAEAVLGRDDRELFVPEQAEMLMAADRQVMRQERALTQEETLDTAHGPRIFLATKGPLRDAEGSVIGVFGVSRDITEQKRAERERQAIQEAALESQRLARRDADEARAKAVAALTALSESEERLRLALSAARQGLYDLDLSTGDAVVTPEYARMLGYEPEEFHETNAAWRERMHPDDQAAVYRVYQDYVAGLIPEYAVEFRQRTKAGEWKWILSLGKIQSWGDDGRPLRMLGTHTDITAVKQAESALRESEGRLKLFFEHAPAALAMFDRQMRYVAVSLRWLDDYGLTGRDLLGLCHYDVFPEIGEDWKAVHRRGLAGEIVRCEEDRFLRADAHVQWLRWEVRPWQAADGAIGGVVVFTEDITGRKRAELEIKRQIERLQEAEAHAHLGSWEFDVDGGQGRWSAQMYELMGVAPATGVPSVEEFLNCLHAEDRPLILEAMNRMGAGVLPEPASFRSNPERGPLRWFSPTVHCERDAHGRPFKFLGTLLDITERKQAEDAILSLNATLEARVAARTAELDALNQSLESFVYSVSHDLKAPLRGVEGYARLLAEDHGDRLNDEGHLFVTNIRGGIQRMSALIDDLLAYSRMERRKLELGPLDLASVVAGALAEHGEEIATRGVAIAQALPPLAVRADADGLKLVLRNLFENALKFSREASAPRIEVGARDDETKVTVWIRDNGIGFDMKYHERIFEIFQRLHRLEDYPGTGIGLALVKKAMQRMGGRVWAQSTPGQGASFYLQLPR